jgi:hypothetical protein
MSRPLRALVLLLFVSACGARYDDPPRNLNDACSIVSQRPNYLKDMKRTERRWDVPVSVQMATIYQESKFDADAKTPFRYALGIIPMGRQSTAFGYSQALDATWEEYKTNSGNRRAKRDNFSDATDFMGWYMHETWEALGIPKNDTRNQYLAYHEGRNGYRRGSYNNKSWLLRVSSEVADRASMYETQLRLCGKI